MHKKLNSLVSREWVERSKNALAQGSPATNSKRWSQYVDGVFPSHTNGFGHGCYLEDHEGRRYMDFVGALGALSLGYSNKKVEEAVIRQVKKGASHSLPTTLEVEVAEILSSFFPDCEAWRFFKNGRDAADCAIRVARAYSGKKVVLSDGYHGCSDLFTSLTKPALGVKDIFHVNALTEHIEWDDVACVILEAIKLDDSEAYQKWLRGMRLECRRRKVLFILDEIITGFRVPKMSVTNWWSLEPDLVLFGKGMANGYPLSALGGKKEILNAQEWFFSTTFGGEAIALSACKEVIREIHSKNLEDLMFYGKRLQQKLNDLDPEIRFEGYGTRCMLNTLSPKTALFMQGMCEAGFLFGKAHFFNFAHLEANVEEIVMASARSVVDQIRENRIQLRGIAPMETFRR